MTLLRRDDGDAGSYLEIAEFISTRGSLSRRGDDLRELWCRVVFNILVSNRDDHLRNHGCILAPDGWTLAPAYDVNPNLDKTHHHLAIDDSDPTPDLRLALATAHYYGLKAEEAATLLKQLKAVVRKWAGEAARLGLPKSQTDEMRAAFQLAET
jgi:serine/threonine-protein kinase HipA